MDDVELDSKDKQILYQLDVNARQPISVIAKKVRLSREVTGYRIKNLEKNGVIQGYYAAIDIAKLGYLYCRIFMRCQPISPQQEKEIIDYGLNHPSIGWITAGHGRWNISFVAYVKDLAEFEKVYDDLRFSLGKYFHEHYVSMAFKIYQFKHNYLFGTKDYTQAVLGNPGNIKLDGKDLTILKLLAKDARTSVVRMASELKLAPNAVKNRIKHLVGKEVIIGFRPTINLALLGYEHHKIFLKFKNLTRKIRQHVISYLHFRPNVIYITKAFGISDLEFEVVTKGRNELYEFMQVFLSNFADFVTDYESILYYREFVNYLP
ncbi:Lrp/AsnC family transcriptional regulator [Candidatus Woesearchaeota archaeon]|nr:Lrp/AsnC family transcriptional regulator [Candidatus Woesearchaeota archaeon]